MRQPSLQATSARENFFYRLLFALMAFFLRYKVRKHISWLRGLANLPVDGPLIIVANHESYFDNYAICALFLELLDRRVYVPTKVKAFRGIVRKVFHEALGAVAVDHAQPKDAYRKIEALLQDGQCVLVFPEGARSVGQGLLPFRYGGFNLSVQHDVPVLPVALHGTARVLPKGQRSFVSAERAGVTFGALLHPADFRSGATDDSEVARRMCEQARGFIEGALEDAEPCNLVSSTGRDTDDMANLAERRVESALDAGIDAITVKQARSLRRSCELALALGLSSLRLEVQYARAYGFWCLALPKVFAAWFLSRYLRMVNHGLARDPRQPYLHYCLGQFYIRAPRILGGDRRRALRELAQAYDAAADYGLDPAKFSVSYASALVENDQLPAARSVLARHFAAEPVSGASERLQNRAVRARAVMDRIGTGSDNLNIQTVRSRP